jgi:3-phosphoshikimate 1-carboxyvinyltransferase
VIEGELVVRAIDELPILAVVAARGTGVTEFRDAAELRVKESDRIATTCAMLRAFGVEVDEHPDGFSVHGLEGRPFAAAAIDAAGDHRIAMSAAVAALAADGAVRVDDVDNVDTSYPTFAATLSALGAAIR